MIGLCAEFLSAHVCKSAMRDVAVAGCWLGAGWPILNS